MKVIYESGEEEHRFVEEWIVLNLKKRRLLMLYSLSRRRGGYSCVCNLSVIDVVFLELIRL